MKHVDGVNLHRRFVVYRPNPPANYISGGFALPPDEVQVEGTEWSDGRCSVRWRTPTRSTEDWDSVADFMKVHGHPEYGTKFVWIDDVPTYVPVPTLLNNKKDE